MKRGMKGCHFNTIILLKREDFIHCKKNINACTRISNHNSIQGFDNFTAESTRQIFQLLIKYKFPK